MIFLIDWQWIWFKNYFEDIKSRKASRILMNIRKMLLFSKSFSVFISFWLWVSIENHPCYPNKEKTYTLFVYSCEYDIILTLYINCYVILTTYMLDSALEPSYKLSKIFYYCHGYWNVSRYGKWFNPPVDRKLNYATDCRFVI